MSNFKSMVFKLDPEQREEQGKLVERYLTALGYEDNVEWNKKRRHDNTRKHIFVNGGKFMYFTDYCQELATIEPTPTPYQVAVAEHMATAPQELAEYVRGRLKKSGFWIEGITPIIMCGFDWDNSEEGNCFWSHIYTQRWQDAMATDFWKGYTATKEAPSEAPSETPTERPKGVIGQWYTLLTDFEGYPNRKAGYTWQCQEVDDDEGRPKIDGVRMGYNEYYRLATPEEIARAKGEHPQPSKPSKEAREFWERAYVAIVQSPRHHDKTVVELADEAMAEWQKRFEQ